MKEKIKITSLIVIGISAPYYVFVLLPSMHRETLAQEKEFKCIESGKVVIDKEINQQSREYEARKMDFHFSEPVLSYNKKLDKCIIFYQLTWGGGKGDILNATTNLPVFILSNNTETNRTAHIRDGFSGELIAKHSNFDSESEDAFRGEFVELFNRPLPELSNL